MASAADVPAPAVESEDDDEEPTIISSTTVIHYISSVITRILLESDKITWVQGIQLRQSRL